MIHYTITFLFMSLVMVPIFHDLTDILSLITPLTTYQVLKTIQKANSSVQCLFFSATFKDDKTRAAVQSMAGDARITNQIKMDMKFVKLDTLTHWVVHPKNPMEGGPGFSPEFLQVRACIFSLLVYSNLFLSCFVLCPSQYGILSPLFGISGMLCGLQIMGSRNARCDEVRPQFTCLD